MSADPLVQVIYVSEAADSLPPEEVHAIMDLSRAKNARMGITGVLFHFNDRFMQVLEGPAAEVRALLARIRRDPRHKGLFIVHEAEIDQREFGSWSMRLVRLEMQELRGWLAAGGSSTQWAEVAAQDMPALWTVSGKTIFNFLRYQAARASSR